MGIVMNLAVNLIFTVILSSVMTFLNVVILGRQGALAFACSFAGSFLPMWMVSSIVAWFAVPLAARITGDGKS